VQLQCYYGTMTCTHTLQHYMLSPFIWFSFLMLRPRKAVLVSNAHSHTLHSYQAAKMPATNQVWTSLCPLLSLVCIENGCWVSVSILTIKPSLIKASPKQARQVILKLYIEECVSYLRPMSL